MGTQNEVFDTEVMGEQLKKLRKSTKLSQEKFAERFGMSKDTIFNYEKGKTAIPHDLIKRLCCQTAHCGRGKPHFIFGGFTSPIVPYRNLPQAPDGMTANCHSLV